jgi:hypothetical protein
MVEYENRKILDNKLLSVYAFLPLFLVIPDERSKE